MATLKLRKVGNGIGLSFPKEVLATAGFQEGQEITVLAAPGVLAISAEPHVELAITQEEAKAISEADWNSPHMQSVRQKILKKLKPS